METGIILYLIFSDGKDVRLNLKQQKLCYTLFLVMWKMLHLINGSFLGMGKMLDLIIGTRNYVRPPFSWWERC